MTNSDYVDRVRALLADLPEATTGEALSDLAELADEFTDETGEVTDEHRGPDRVEAALGTPEEYAARLRSALTEDSLAEPDGPAAAWARVGGIPVDLRGPAVRAVRSRLWDPADPALLVPKAFGVGWDVNLGAVAVRLGLLRPDDVDDDVVGAIPPAAMATARLVPVALAGGTAAYLARVWSRLPDRVPTRWSASGRPSSHGARGMLAAMTGLALGATAWAQLADDREDALVRTAVATVLSAAVAGTTRAAVRDAGTGPGEPGHGLLVPAALVAGAGLSLGVLVGPIRAGLRAVWRRPAGVGVR